ncbi:MAG: hypothetical protein Q9221_005948 [Calogaya cf. arnoldii]
MSTQTTVPTRSNKRSAIITGSARGMPVPSNCLLKFSPSSGKATALRLAHDGFDICVNDICANSDDVETVVQEIKDLGRNTYAHVADVTSVEGVNNLMAESVKNLGPLNVMVANAGIAQVKGLLDLTEK